jgi:hypothetical protein
MWVFECAKTTTAAPAAVWERWTTPECWAEQDEGIEWARLRGQLAVGSTIELKPSHGPKTTVTISRLAAGTAFPTQGRLPGCRLTIDHEITAGEEVSEFTHRITMRGVTVPIFRRLFGNAMAAGLPAMLTNIARLAEQKQLAASDDRS